MPLTGFLGGTLGLGVYPPFGAEQNATHLDGSLGKGFGAPGLYGLSLFEFRGLNLHWVIY